VFDYIDSFPLQYKNIEESAQLLPQPLEGVMDLINETVKSFFQQHNYGNSSMKGFMMYCRPSVEKYIFSHLYERLYEMYKCKNKERDNEFRKAKTVAQSLTSMELFRTLKVPKEFMLGTEEEKVDPYGNCVEILNRSEKSISPGEKVKDIMRMYTETKIAVINYRGEKAELQNVNDQVRVLAYILAKADLKFPNTEFNLLKDYVCMQETSNTAEEFAITNLQVLLLTIPREV